MTPYRCGVAPEQVARLGGPPDWHCSDVKFSVAFVSIDRLDDQSRSAIEAIPTRLSLVAAQIDSAVEGGRQATLASPRLHEYLRERVGARPEAASEGQL